MSKLISNPSKRPQRLIKLVGQSQLHGKLDQLRKRKASCLWSCGTQTDKFYEHVLDIDLGTDDSPKLILPQKDGKEALLLVFIVKHSLPPQPVENRTAIILFSTRSTRCLCLPWPSQ